jgi:EmrB/QacA subfamily drug resistance transporter
MTAETASAAARAATPAPTEHDAPARHALLLTVCCVAQFMVILDVSIVNVALPSIRASLGFSLTDSVWVINAYTITFAGFLMLSGRAADLFGQRRTFVTGLLLFALASLIGGTAIDKGALVGARALQGLGGAGMAAASLAIITSSFAAGPERFRAIGLWGAMSGAGGAAGTLLGGIITEALTWRWVLLINLPIGIAAALVARVVVAEHRRARDASSFDLGGALAITGGLVALVYGIVTAGRAGWGSAEALGPITLGVVLLGLFVLIEARFAAAPLVPLRVFASKPLRVANGVVLLFSAALFPMWYLTTLYLQEVLHMRPLGAGLTFLPMALTIMACASQAGALVGRFGVRTVLGVGLTLMAVGMALFSRVAVNGSPIVYVMVPGLFFSTGVGLSIVPSTIAATAGAARGEEGLASGLVNTSRQMGGALGLAILAALGAQYASHLIGSDYRTPTEALTDGFKLGYLIGAGFVAIAAVMTFRLIPKLPARPSTPVPGPAAGPAVVTPLPTARTARSSTPPAAEPMPAHVKAAPAAPKPAPPAAQARHTVSFQLSDGRRWPIANGSMTIRAAVLLAALAMCAALCACGDSGSSRAAADVVTPKADLAEARANPVAVSPLPGTEDASPSSQISFLGEPGTKVADVSVVGSRSGTHPGKLEPYSTGTGASFVPNRPFGAGEQVAVHALVGTGSATPEKPVTTIFTIVHQASVSQTQFPKEPGDPHAIQHYGSAPSLTPSTVRITTSAQPGAAPGDLFMAPYQGLGTPGPMISEQNGTLLWFHPLPAGEKATNFQVQQYEGRPVLTWWQGRTLQVGFGQGEDVIYDNSYKQVATIRGGNGYKADLHEIRLTQQGTAWIDSFDPIDMNLASLHGAKNGILTDSVVQEIDVKTGLVMWEWHALGHVPLQDSTMAPSRSSYPWDYIHVNSVDPGSSNDVLLSARNTCALYDVDIRTGAFNWQLGGRHSTFKLGPGTKTYFQHDAEWQPGGLISVFDNGATPVKEKQSRGILLKPNYTTKTVALAKAFVNPTKTLLAAAQGNTLGLPEGDWLMGYGNLPNFTEYDSAGRVVLDGTLGRGVQDFRTYMSSWAGHPTTQPAIVAKRSGASVTLQTSWNGATEVASWQLLAGESPSSLTALATVPKSGFETTATLTTSAPYVESRALDANGNVLGASAPSRVR